jgi:hypothetical protein
VLPAAAGSALAADLDHYYEPPGPAVLPPPPCGVYRPCFRAYPRYGFVPRYPLYRPYAYPADRFYRYGYARPRLPRMSPEFERERYGYEGPRYGATERYGDEERRRAEERFFVAPPGYAPYPHGRG